jgi:tyrosinase
MFDNALNPSNALYNPYIKDFQTYRNYLNPALTRYWNGLTVAQRNQLGLRMIPSLDSLWSQVQGDPTNGSMFATTPYARYITAASPQLDAATQKMVAPDMVKSGLTAPDFAKFNSIRTESHNAQPANSSVFGILEGNPHNKVHNNIGGVGHVTNVLNFGYMADNLSPTDPVFFLHHANMDRLWDVWTRRQQALGLPVLPTDADLETFEREPFLFFVNAQGKPVLDGKAGDFISAQPFGYDYEPGFGEELIGKPALVASAAANGSFAGKITDGHGNVSVPEAALRQNATDRNSQPLVVQVTVPRPKSASAPREFDVLINAPAGTTKVAVDSPYYAGSISFFGFMRGMTGDATFTVPLPRNLPVTTGPLTVQVIPSVTPGALLNAARGQPKSVLKAVTVTAW